MEEEYLKRAESIYDFMDDASLKASAIFALAGALKEYYEKGLADAKKQVKNDT